MVYHIYQMYACISQYDLIMILSRNMTFYKCLKNQTLTLVALNAPFMHISKVLYRGSRTQWKSRLILSHESVYSVQIVVAWKEKQLSGKLTT